jgi:aminoglycoside/choline kinase family phosphotransferase
MHMRQLYHDHFGRWPKSLKPVYSSGGSTRKYYRLASKTGSAIGAWNPDRDENSAFLYFSRFFKDAGLHVPAVYGEDIENDVYLVEDLGDISLLDLVKTAHNKGTFPGSIRDLYRQSLKELIGFQVAAMQNLDFSYCYPREAFDTQSMAWDLNYFKYYFLKLHAGFHEEKLEDDFIALMGFLGQADSDFFMYRDFQARNVMIRDDQAYFIDYQGGRRGPLQYDVASLLFQATAALPADFREEMLQFYIDELSKYIKVDNKTFRKYYDGFVLIRILQVLGAYGFRGLIEKKPYFMLSIPNALENLKWWLSNTHLPLEIPELRRCLESLVNIEKYRLDKHITHGKLTVAVSSFSYKNSIPGDFTGYGGGFVFDCRALPNPGREEQYREFNGRDQVVIDYLNKYTEVADFLSNAEKLVSQSVEQYLERKFERLSVQFGCTGGQHRSVYCAEKMANFLREHYPMVIVKIEHLML